MFLQVSLVISYIYISRQSLSVSFRVKEKAMSICIRYNTRFIMENPTALKNTTALPTRHVIVPQCPNAIINLQVPQYIQCHAQCIGNDFFHTRLGTDVLLSLNYLDQTNLSNYQPPLIFVFSLIQYQSKQYHACTGHTVPRMK